MKRMTALLAAILLAATAIPVRAQLHEDFETYPPGQSIVGVGPYVHVSDNGDGVVRQFENDPVNTTRVLVHDSNEAGAITRLADSKSGKLIGEIVGQCDVLPFHGDHSLCFWQDNTHWNNMALVSFNANDGTNAVLARGEEGKLVCKYESGRWYRVTMRIHLDEKEPAKARYDAMVQILEAGGKVGKTIGEVRNVRGFGAPTHIAGAQIQSQRLKNGKLEARFDNWSMAAVTAAPAGKSETPAAGHSFTVPWKEQALFRFETPRVDPGRRAYLACRIRIDSNGTDITGSYYALKMQLNQQLVELHRLVNKPVNMTLRAGWESPWFGGDSWRIVYAKAFKDCDVGGSDQYDVMNGDPFQFELDVTDLLGSEHNELALSNTLPSSVTLPVIVEDVRVVVREGQPPPALEPVVGETIQGPLPVYVEKPIAHDPFTVDVADGGGFTITIAGKRYAFASSFTYPDSGWNTLTAPGARAKPDPAGRPIEDVWKPAVSRADHGIVHVNAEGRFYRLHRRVHARPDRVDIEDELTNLTDADVAVMYRHEGALPARPQTAVICGNTQTTGHGEAAFPENPAAYVATNASSVAVLRRDDASRVQGISFVTPPDVHGVATVGLSNRRFCLGPKASHTLRWSVFPQARDDYWQYVNTARRALDVNFTIPGGFSFFYTESRFTDLSLDQLSEFANIRGLAFASTGIGELPRVGDAPFIYAHGTAIRHAAPWIAQTGALIEKWKSAAPDLRTLIYFHSYCSTEPGAPEKYAADRMLDPDGKHLYYDYTDKTRYYPLFYPTLENSYGKALGSYFDTAFNDLHADGLYWDEMSHTNVEYCHTGPWDGVTADIDPTTFRVIRRIANVSLLSQAWRYTTAAKLLADGRALVANTMPQTETMAALHFPRFVETAPLSMIHKSQLYTPIGLGDAVINERTEDDVNRQVRRHLDHAALYYYYNGRIPITHENLTASMFPFTPVEIRPGVMIAKERILVSRPGVFGWADGKAPARVLVFDDKGRAVDGAAFAEPTEHPGALALRLPFGHTAALLRD